MDSPTSMPVNADTVMRTTNAVSAQLMQKSVMTKAFVKRVRSKDTLAALPVPVWGLVEFELSLLREKEVAMSNVSCGEKLSVESMRCRLRIGRLAFVSAVSASMVVSSWYVSKG